MTKTLDHPVLHKPIASLDVSKEFKRMAEANHYTTLAEIVREPLRDLPHKQLSGYRLLRELLTFLEQHGLHDLIED
jgi:precorrin-6x reductase